MGYVCPVCGTFEADGEHLADHLAITALARGGDHERWLAETAPGWAEMGRAELADEVVEHALEREPPGEPATGGRPEGRLEDALAARSGPGRSGPRAGGLDDETARILSEARELTERMMEDAADRESAPADDEDADDGGEN